MTDDLGQSGVSTYSLPLPPAAATLTEGLSMALKLSRGGKTGWVVLIGSFR